MLSVEEFWPIVSITRTTFGLLVNDMHCFFSGHDAHHPEATRPMG